MKRQCIESIGSYDLSERVQARLLEGWFVAHVVAVGGIVHVVFERTHVETTIDCRSCGQAGVAILTEVECPTCGAHWPVPKTSTET